METPKTRTPTIPIPTTPEAKASITRRAHQLTAQGTDEATAWITALTETTGTTTTTTPTT